MATIHETKERPILFSAPMVRAILAGTKTKTRRVVKPQPPAGWDRNCWFSAPVWGWTAEAEPTQTWHKVRCPYGQPGDRLWVREAWARTSVFPGTDLVVYREGDSRTDYGGPWKPSIHMPRWASRITLEVTGVRVERLQDISDDDLDCEGLQAVIDAGVDHDGTPRDAWRALWASINGPGSWDANPLVWVVEFKRIDAAMKGE